MKTTKEDQHLYNQYIHDINQERKIVLFWQCIIIIGFIGLWELASRMAWIDPLLFSSPSHIVALLVEKFSDGSIVRHIGVTVMETVLGFIIGTLLGVLLASSLWTSKRYANVMDPYLVVLNAMPKVALGPIIIVAMGPGYGAIIAMGAIISVIITTIVIFSGFREVDPNYEKVLKSFGATKWQCFKEAIFPATLPVMISTLKVNVGLSWVGVIVGEFLVSKEGLGYLIVYGFQVFDFTLVMASLVVIAVFAALMYKIVEKIESWLIKKAT